jgi:hypothetical protein
MPVFTNDLPELTDSEDSNINSQDSSHFKRRSSSYSKVDNSARDRIISAYLSGKSATCIASYEKIPRTTVYTIIDIFKKSGRIAKKEKGGKRNFKVTTEISSYIRSEVDLNCSI